MEPSIFCDFIGAEGSELKNLQSKGKSWKIGIEKERDREREREKKKRAQNSYVATLSLNPTNLNSTSCLRRNPK